MNRLTSCNEKQLQSYENIGPNHFSKDFKSGWKDKYLMQLLQEWGTIAKNYSQEIDCKTAYFDEEQV